MSAPTLQAEALLRVLGEHRVEFVIIGGFALSAHGVVRGTKDIDVLPEPSTANVRRLVAALRDLEAEPMLAAAFDPSELGIELDEEGLRLGGNWVLRTRLGRLDVMQDVPGDDLIAMKVAAGRPQDEIDITSLERARRRPGSR